MGLVQSLGPNKTWASSDQCMHYMYENYTYAWELRMYEAYMHEYITRTLRADVWRLHYCAGGGYMHDVLYIREYTPKHVIHTCTPRYQLLWLLYWRFWWRLSGRLPTTIGGKCSLRILRTAGILSPSANKLHLFGSMFFFVLISPFLFLENPLRLFQPSVSRGPFPTVRLSRSCAAKSQSLTV